MTAECSAGPQPCPPVLFSSSLFLGLGLTGLGLTGLGQTHPRDALQVLVGADKVAAVPMPPLKQRPYVVLEATVL